MAMAFHERRELEERPVKIMGERMAVQRSGSVPARSRAATARKLEEVAEPATELAEEISEQVATRPRSRAAQAQAEVARTRAGQEAAQREQERLEVVEKLEAKRDELVERLDKGAARIEDARSKGKDVSEWEDYWIQLLRQYEQICDKLHELN